MPEATEQTELITPFELTAEELYDIFEAYTGHCPSASSQAHHTDRKTPPDEPFTRLLPRILDALDKLNPERAQDYELWERVGCALYHTAEAYDIDLYGPVMCDAWDEWSKQSSKFEEGECAEKWDTFATDRDAVLTEASLFAWATEDEGERVTQAGGKVVKKAPKNCKTSHIMEAVDALGYHVGYNDAAGAVYCNGTMLDDLTVSEIRCDLRDHGYRSMDWVKDALDKLAAQNCYNPMRDFFDGLKWDGRDRLGELNKYFEDKRGVFPLYNPKFMLGVVARTYRPGTQVRMFVLQGDQGIGKGFYPRWLASPFPDYFIVSPIQLRDKDCFFRLTTKAIWEVSELGSSTRHADVELLKDFLTRDVETQRRPYGHGDIIRRTTACLVGTVNDSEGFLNDPTGYRRFMIVDLTGIDKSYSEKVDVVQLWAQIKALYDAGETWELTSDEYVQSEEISREHEVEQPIFTWVLEFLKFTHQPEDFVATSDIVAILQGEYKVRDSPTGLAMQIRPLLLENGCKKGRPTLHGVKVAGYRGCRLRFTAASTYGNGPHSNRMDNVYTILERGDSVWSTYTTRAEDAADFATGKGAP